MLRSKKRKEMDLQMGSYVMINKGLLTKEQMADENRVFRLERKIHTPFVEVDKKYNVTSMILFEGTFSTDETIALITEKDIMQFAKREDIRKAKERLLNHARWFEFTHCLKRLKKVYKNADMSLLLGIINAEW